MNTTLFSTEIATPIGQMIAIADEKFLYLLEFLDKRRLESEFEALKQKLNAHILPGRTQITEQIEKELFHYFSGESFDFKTPCYLWGTAFQKKVWQVLQSIPSGQTYSYLELATAVGNVKASRAVGHANGRNPLAIIVPCHRVIQRNGSLGGYSAGLNRKQWLLDHEMRNLPA